MGNYGAHVWTITITIFTFMLGFMIWFFGYNNMKNTITSDNLQDAVRTSAYMAHDNSARTQRGAFVINKNKFNDYLKKTKIKQFGDTTLGSNGSDYTVYYLPDTAKADEYGNETNTNHNDNTHLTNEPSPWIASHDSSKYETVRGVRVVVNAKNKPKIIGHNDVGDKNPNSKDHQMNRKSLSKARKYGQFTATDIIQTYGKTNSTSRDGENDLTR